MDTVVHGGLTARPRLMLYYEHPYLSVTRKISELENNTESLVRSWPVLGRINELRCRAYG